MLFALTALVWFGQAHAQAVQPGFDAHGFHLAAHDGDLRDPLVVQRPGPFSQGDLFFSGLGEYAKSPLVLVSTAEFGGQVIETPVLDNVVAMNLSAGIAAHDRLRFDLTAPVYFVTADPLEGTQGPAMGDVRLAAMLVGLRPDHIAGGGGLGVAVIPHIDLPVGTPDRFLGQASVAGGWKLATTYELSAVTFSGDLGMQINPTLDLENLNGSDTFLAGLGIGVLASDQVGFTAEVVAQPPLDAPENLSFPAEALLSLRYKDPGNGSYWTFGGAAGLSDGPGVAAFRLFIGAGIAKQAGPRQADFDLLGSFRSADQCPESLEVVNGWKDDDGCPDTLSALAVDVRYKLQPWTADATITGPDGARTERVTPDGLQLDAVPGSLWSVVASTDACLVGEGEATASEGGAALVVNLRQVWDAKVLVEVLGPDDQPIPGATVLWQSDKPTCITQGQVLVSHGGTVEQDIGQGTHRVVVTAPGHTVHEEDVDFVSGEHKILQIHLDRTLIRVDKKQIVILEKVHFETAKAVIKAESFGLLNEVAATVVTNPELGRVEVAGHTDSRGSDAYNQTLSQARAEAVRVYMIEQGVPPEQLSAVGYGETIPIDTNKTPEGREANRRVAFNLIDRTQDTEAEDLP